MLSKLAALLVSACIVAKTFAECPNACSAHGKCGAYDMCTCYRNWMSNDCSERICQFGLAHVDTPKGDLDSSSGRLSDSDTLVVVGDSVYPYGTTEQYPMMQDSAGTTLDNTAHEYRECSNKGICDRATGTCACFDGYDGSACQRASCPTTNGQVCSGHGTCETIREIAARDSSNIYELWDAHSTMGCVCDGGYSGADCSERVCKYGADPLYFDQGATGRYANWTYQFYTATTATSVTGNYSIIFYDAHDEDWRTDPIDIGATCADVVGALEALPNNVIPAGTVRCFKNNIFTSQGQDSSAEPIYDNTVMKVWARYTLAFQGNPGRLNQIEISTYLDGNRPTLYSDETTSTLGWHVYPNGFTGEDTDMVPNLCEGVTVTLDSDSFGNYLTGLTTQTEKKLKACLGDSNGDSTDNIEVYNWDYGSIFNPHLIKLVDQTQYTSTVVVDANQGDSDNDPYTAQVPVTNLCHPDALNSARFGVGAGSNALCANINPPGFYAVLHYSPSHSANPFRLYTRPATAYSDTTTFKVYTTTGYLQLVSAQSAVFTDMLTYSNKQKREHFYTRTLHVTNTTANTVYNGYFGAMDCETQTVGTYGLLDCLEKDDFVMFLNHNGSDPIFPNMYQVKNIGRHEKSYRNDPQPSSNPNSEKVRQTITLDYSVNQRMTYTTGLTLGDATDTTARVYKFHPDTSGGSVGGYNYAAPCSNRGICNGESGLCECFPGYTNDNCDTINALAA